MTKVFVGTYDAVETSIELARSEKKGTWEGITEKKRRKIVKWDDLSNAKELEEIKINRKTILNHLINKCNT